LVILFNCCIFENMDAMQMKVVYTINESWVPMKCMPVYDITNEEIVEALETIEKDVDSDVSTEGTMEEQELDVSSKQRNDRNLGLCREMLEVFKTQEPKAKYRPVALTVSKLKSMDLEEDRRNSFSTCAPESQRNTFEDMSDLDDDDDWDMPILNTKVNLTTEENFSHASPVRYYGRGMGIRSFGKADEDEMQEKDQTENQPDEAVSLSDRNRGNFQSRLARLSLSECQSEGRLKQPLNPFKPPPQTNLAWCMQQLEKEKKENPVQQNEKSVQKPRDTSPFAAPQTPRLLRTILSKARVGRKSVNNEGLEKPAIQRQKSADYLSSGLSSTGLDTRKLLRQRSADLSTSRPTLRQRSLDKLQSVANVVRQRSAGDSVMRSRVRDDRLRSERNGDKTTPRESQQNGSMYSHYPVTGKSDQMSRTQHNSEIARQELMTHKNNVQRFRDHLMKFASTSATESWGVTRGTF
jgi:hypothetical protein